MVAPLVLTGLAALAIEFAPKLANYLWGPQAAEVTSEIGDVVQSLTGTRDPDEVKEATSDDRQLSSELRVKLAEIAERREAQQLAAQAAERQAQIDELKNAQADTANARAAMLALANSGSKLQYGAAIISTTVMVLFVYMVVAQSFGLFLNEMTIRLIEYAVILVLGYWLGSSAGSARKDTRMAAMEASTPYGSPQGPPAIATTGNVTVEAPNPPYRPVAPSVAASEPSSPHGIVLGAQSPVGTTTEQLNAASQARTRNSRRKE